MSKTFLTSKDFNSLETRNQIEKGISGRIQDLYKGGSGTPIHKEGDSVTFEGKEYKAGKHDPSTNLRYLHDPKTGQIASQHNGSALQVHETKVSANSNPNMNKAEGSKGGKVIGHSAAGHPIYQHELKKIFF